LCAPCGVEDALQGTHMAGAEQHTSETIAEISGCKIWHSKQQIALSIQHSARRLFRVKEDIFVGMANAKPFSREYTQIYANLINTILTI